MRIDQPFDSTIAIDVGSRGEDVVDIPPAGVKLTYLLPTLFLLFWLGGWAVGLVFAAREVTGPSVPWAVRLFLIVWLGGWSLGGFMAWHAVTSMLVAMFGRERLAFDFDNVAHTRTAFGIRRTRRYPTPRVQRFERPRDHRQRWSRWPVSTAECSMIYGKRRIPVAHGVTDVEADWLVEELNSLLARRKR